MVAVVDAQRVVFRMPGRLEGGHEEHVLFGAAEHVVLRVQRQDRRERFADEEGRGGRVRGDAIAGLASFLAHRVVGEHLAADLGDAGDRTQRETMRLEPFRIHAHEQSEVTAGRVSADEDLAGVAAMFRDVLDRPGESRRRVVDIGRILRLGTQPIVRRHDRDAGLGEALADLGAVFRTEVLGAVLQAAAVEPDITGEALDACRYGEVELAAVLFVGSEGDDVILVGYVLDDLGLDRAGRGDGEAEQQAGEAHQAMIDWTILPWTSVRRKSRPELRKVNSS